jgi:hypothetical protein
MMGDLVKDAPNIILLTLVGILSVKRVRKVSNEVHISKNQSVGANNSNNNQFKNNKKCIKINIETKKAKSTTLSSKNGISVSRKDTLNKKSEQPSELQQQAMMAQFPCWQDDILNVYHPSMIPFPQQYNCYTDPKGETDLTSSISSSMLIPNGNPPMYPFFPSKNQNMTVSHNFLPQPLLSDLVENNQKQQTNNDGNCTIDLNHFDFCKQSQEIDKLSVSVSAINKCHNQDDYFFLH